MITVVLKGNIIEKRTVKVGEKTGDFWIISEGLKENEQVVYEGIQKVRNKMEVKPLFKQFVSQTNVLETK